MSNNEIKKENKQKNRYQPLLTFQVTWVIRPEAPYMEQL